MSYENLLGGPPATFLLDDAEASAALADAKDPADVAARFPSYCAAWAALAAQALDRGEPVAAYAYALTGYHRGLDQLRRSGWKGPGITSPTRASSARCTCSARPPRRSASRTRRPAARSSSATAAPRPPGR